MWKNQNGQGVLEYLILVALVTLVCVSSLKSLGTKLNSKIKEAKDHIENSIPVNLSP